jgi:uncharacterized membrane protein
MVEVSDDFAHGAHIRCTSCHTSMRVVRGAGVGPRLVHADVEPVRDALSEGERRQRNAEAELRTARASLGIGVNGLGLGVLYVVAKVGIEDLPLTSDLIYAAVAIAIVSGVALELVNFFLLAKRRRMSELGAEIDELRSGNRELRRKLREAMRA